MPRTKSTKREYDSSRRQAQADETRRRILESARRIFMERGYAGATAEAIAAEAGVAAQTIYAIFKNKKKLLISLMNVSPTTGTEDHTPMLERANVQVIGQERDQRRQLEMFANVVANNLDQVAGVAEVLMDAAKVDPDLNRIVQKLNRQRVDHMTAAVEQIAAHGSLRAQVNEEYARDTILALTSGEVFLQLTRESGWSKEKYAQWLADMLIRALLP